MEQRPTYNAIQSQASQQVFRYALKQGQMGPLVFLWAVGIAMFVWLQIWPLVLPWTPVVLVFGYGMIRSYLGRRQIRQQLLRSVLERQCLGRESWDTSVWMSGPIRRGSDILVKAALDINKMELERSPDPDIRRAFADASSILWLQYSLAENAGDLERGLRSVSSAYSIGSYLPTTDLDVTVPAGTLDSNRGTIEELSTQSNARVDDISEQLEAFLSALQMLKDQRACSYQVAAAGLARETADVLGRMQAWVGWNPTPSGSLSG